MDISPTPHPDVNEILDLLFTNTKEILNDQLIGMYLFGSLANSGFDRESDIDILFATKDEITKEAFSAQYSMHEKIAAFDSPWAIQLEVSYIPRDALRRYDSSNNRHPHLDRGNGEKLHVMRHDSDWIIQRHILREKGITVMGPDPKTLIDPVSPDDLRRAVADIMHTWIKGFLTDSRILESRGYQSYTVLTLCRILYTWEQGAIVSKPFAAEWAKQTLDPAWTPLIECAWLSRQNPQIPAEPGEIHRTLDFIRYTLEKMK